jgi:quinolinate synthase
MAQHILKKHEEIIFVPDKYLAQYVSQQVRHNFIMWNGYCPTHVKILPENIVQAKKRHPQAKVLVHPECKPDLTALADFVASTEKMCVYSHNTAQTDFIIATENGIIHRLKKENPAKNFYPAAAAAVCPNMKRITVEKVLWSLQDLSFEVTVPPDIMDKARLSIERMLQIT